MTTEIEDKAKGMGWSPKDEFRGDPDNWVDAETFVQRGEEFIPFLKATTKKQSDEIANLRGELQKTQALLKASSEAIEALKEFNSEANREAMKEKKTELLTALAEAKREGNVEEEVQLVDQLTEHNAAVKEAAKKPNGAAPKPEGTPRDFTQDPLFVAWKSENPWFGPDKRKTALSLGIADELRSDPSNAGLQGKAFFDRVSEEVAKVFGGNARREAPGRTAEGSRSTGGGDEGGKSFADLPAEAKAACDKQASRLVGEGRAYKTNAEWRKKYVSIYFEEQA